MKTRKGFTLIELLIVVTIIAILAGAAIPYVQDYVEQARTGRAKADLDEIKRAIMLYEVQYGPYTSSSIASLVGPFLTKNTPDPWSNAYVVDDDKSIVYSNGQDGLPNTGDEVVAEFRPRMAATRAYFVDVDGDEAVSVGDAIHVKFCRSGKETDNDATLPQTIVGTNFTKVTLSDGGELEDVEGEWISSSFASFTIATPGTLKVGSSTIIILAGNGIKDRSDVEARADTLKIIAQ